MAEKQKVDYIGGKDPFYVANRLRGLSEEELDDFYSDATSGRGGSLWSSKLGPKPTAWGIPIDDRLSLRWNKGKQIMGAITGREDYAPDSFANDEAQLRGLIEQERKRRQIAESRKLSGSSVNYYTHPTAATEAARLANQEESREYEKNRHPLTPVFNLFTGEGDRIKSDYYANREREMQLGDLANQLYDIDIAGEPLPKELLNQFRNLGGEEYVPLSERTPYQRMLTDDVAPDEKETPPEAPAAAPAAGKPAAPAAGPNPSPPPDTTPATEKPAPFKLSDIAKLFPPIEEKPASFKLSDIPKLLPEPPPPAPATPATPATEKPATPATEKPAAPAAEKPAAPAAEKPAAPKSFVDAVDKKVSSALDEKPEAPVSVEPANEEALAQWRETLKKDFVKIMGSEYDPNSSMDFDKMKLLADIKRENPELSTNALALKIYRSGKL